MIRTAIALMLTILPLAAVETATVHRIVIDDLLADRYDVELILYERDGAFYHGYALVPEHDNLIHPVDCTPSAPYRFIDTASGEAIAIPDNMRSAYSYRNDDFNSWKDRYLRGAIAIEHTDPTTPLDPATMTGTIDVLINQVDAPNVPGRCNASRAYRLVFAGDQATSWSYAEGDENYGADAPRTQHAITHRIDDAAWQPEDADAFPAGADWPQVHGPHLNGSAIPYAGDLVANLHDARPAWVSEERIGGGRSAGFTRGDFAMAPFAWTGLGYGGYAGPAVADGRVYLHHMYADPELIAAVEGIDNDPFVRLGGEASGHANGHDAYRDAVLCVDARTGQTLWHWMSERNFGNIRTSKHGRGTTTCIAQGRVFAVGHGGLYCLDAESGDLLWERGGSEGVSYGSGGGNGSREMSPAYVGGSIILCRNGTVVAIDPQTGEQRWQLAHVTGGGAVAAKATIDGQELLVVVGQRRVPSRRERERGEVETPEDLQVIEPISGTVVYRSEALGSNLLAPLVWGDLIAGNGVRELEGQNISEQWRISGARLGREGATHLWDNPDIVYPAGRATPVAHQGVAYIDSHSGFGAVDMTTGETLGRLPHIYHQTGGSHNWTWHIASNNRIITSGGVMISTAEEGFRPLPGRLALDYASGYACPIKPAIADGRLFVRTADSLVCYDLRRRDAGQTQAIELTASGAMQGLGSDRDDDIDLRIRVRNGEPFELGAHWQQVLSNDRFGLPDWLGEYHHHHWRATIPHDLTLDATGLRGEAIVRIGYNHERWAIALQREGDRFTGTYTRRATPLTQPIAIAGAVGGQHLVREDGSGSAWAFYLPNAIASGPILATGEHDQALSILVRIDTDGNVISGLAVSGRSNTQPWELDPGTLTLTDGRLTGTCTVLIHDDLYQDIHFERAQAQRRQSGDGGTVAIAMTLDAGLAGNQLTGSFSGTIGAGWEQTGALTGTIGIEE